MAAPGNFLLSDFSKIERSQLLHVSFQVLETMAGKLPAPGSKADADAFCAAFTAFNAGQVWRASNPFPLQRHVYDSLHSQFLPRNFKTIFLCMNLFTPEKEVTGEIPKAQSINAYNTIFLCTCMLLGYKII